MDMVDWQVKWLKRKKPSSRLPKLAWYPTRSMLSSCRNSSRENQGVLQQVHILNSVMRSPIGSGSPVNGLMFFFDWLIKAGNRVFNVQIRYAIIVPVSLSIGFIDIVNIFEGLIIAALAPI